ncbi:hypothetical protein Ssi02_77640 [Sinosporangium siamense]|uniref:CRISPR system Cascade subunit CasB n=2 Tax=Sinosporangium siamense TaxID=1367973 RepID=A0A919VBM5_9ACTN|nr:hypothetical protein Ssi02_77640 [Sinosporangium siamense]
MVLKAHATVVPWLPALPSRAVESAYYSIAALIAAQPANRRAEKPASELPAPPEVPTEEEKKSERPTASLGETLGLAVRDKKLNLDTTEARLLLLCRQDVTGLHRQLPGLVRQLTAKELTPDWGRLLIDLSRWGHGRDRVVKRWIQDFHRTISLTVDNANSENEE